MSELVITGTGTDVGKTIVTAAVAALALGRGRRVAVLKPAQTGVAEDEPGDLAEVRRLTGRSTAEPIAGLTAGLTTLELGRYPEPLAPDTAARRSGRPPVHPSAIAAAATGLGGGHDLVLVEGAGGLLVRFDERGGTLADVAWSLGAPVLLVAAPGLGTLNVTALTAEALSRRGVRCLGVVVGRWPAEPDLAMRCNLADLPRAAGAPLLGVLPDGIAGLPPAEFHHAARRALAPALNGELDIEDFTLRNTAAAP